MTTYELNIQQAAKIKMQQHRLKKSENEKLQLEKKPTPTPAAQLRMLNRSLQEKQRREILLQLSQHWRDTHMPTPFPMTFQMRHNNTYDLEKEQKLMALARSIHQRQQVKVQHQKQEAAEKIYEQIHSFSP